MTSPPQAPRLALAHPATPELQAAAASHGIPLLGEGEEPGSGLVLRQKAGRLELVWAGENSPGPLCIDFGEAGLRGRLAAGRNQALARAIGIPQGRRRVLDASAGLGRDAFLLASLGCQVLALELDPILFLMLNSALERAKEDDALQAAAGRLDFIQADSLLWLRELEGTDQDRPEVIYLDPMFPDRGKSAKAKKEMEYLRYLLGDQEDQGAAILEKARQLASHRVVVKRVHRAPPLIDPDRLPPLASVKSRLLRFDIYAPASPNAQQAG
ncbi:MAG: class I SAM-dependent methyltransferase [Planctomycetota bacterium]|jgi:16S rRNA (guanine1516-N2)-methyltransferase